MSRDEIVNMLTSHCGGVSLTEDQGLTATRVWIDDMVDEMVEKQKELLLSFCEFLHSGTYDSHNTTFEEDVNAFIESNESRNRS